MAHAISLNPPPEPERSTVTTVERIRDPTRLPALARAWDELIDERDPGAVFRSSAWLLPWWRRFSAGRQLCIYATMSGMRMVGVVPAYHVKSPLGGRQLRLLGDGIVTSDHLGTIARPGEQNEAAEAIAGAMLEAERDIVLDGLTATDPLAFAVRRAASRAGAACFTRSEVCPYVPIDVLPDFATWIRGRPPEVAQLPRRLRWLEKRPGFRIETLTGESEIAAGLPSLWRLHRARWAHDGGTRALAEPKAEQFHAESARQLARRGWARLYVVHADGAPRAALYGFERGGRFSYYQSGSDPDWRRRSVGTVVVGAALEDAFARGSKEFDFLRGLERYKTLYTPCVRELVTLQVATGPRARAVRVVDRGQLLGTAAARRVLPAVRGLRGSKPPVSR